MPGHGDGARRSVVAAVGQRCRKPGRWVGVVAVGLVGVVWLASTALGAVVQIPVRATQQNEFQGAATAGYEAWAQSSLAHPNLDNVFVRRNGRSPVHVNHVGTQGDLGGFDGTTLIYQQFERARNQSDIKLFNLVTHRRTNPPIGVNTPAWEYHPTISGAWILFGRQTISARRRQIILFNLSTRQRIVLADRPEGPLNAPSLLPGQVNGNFAVWWQCTSTACSVWEYDIAAATKTQLPNMTPGRYNYAPSVDTAGTVYFAHNDRFCGGGAIEKRPIGGPTSIVVTFSGRDIEQSYVWDGTTQLNLLYARFTCSTGSGDIYKIVSP